MLTNFQDQSTSDMLQLQNGILKQFVDNLELIKPNTLRIIQMRSYSGAEPFPFSSDHIAWRETASNPYCVYDSSEESSLRWIDVSTVNGVQPWKIAPVGFGIFLDIRCGSQLVIIAMAMCSNDKESKGYFTRWGRYLQGFDQLDAEIFSGNAFEAIQLQSGNRL